MKNFLIILIAAVLVVGSLSGCAGAKVYGQEDTNISVNAGDSFTIKLDENITTGYRWSYTISDEDLIKLEKDEYVQDSKSENLVGSGGKRVLTFETVSKGNATIDMVYERSFEKNPDNTKITYQVEIK